MGPSMVCKLLLMSRRVHRVHVCRLQTFVPFSSARSFSSSRALSSSGTDANKSEGDEGNDQPGLLTTTPADAPSWVHMLNEALQKYPGTTFGSFVVLDAVSLVGFATLYTTLGVVVPTDFALAFGISRLFRRVLIPVDLAVAAVMARAYPPLTMVKPSAMFAFLKRAPEGGAASPAPTPAPEPGMFKKAFGIIMETGDKYGLAYMVAQKGMGITSVFTIYAALTLGVDVQGYLERSEWSASLLALGQIGAAWSAAAVTAAPLFPVILLSAGAMGIRIGKRREAKQAQRAD